jgi:hypothetical protein
MYYEGEYFMIPTWRFVELEKIYAGLDVGRELYKMEEWLDANPKRRKKNYKRFINGWLNKAHAQLMSGRHEGLRNAEVGKFDAERRAPDYSAECAEILRKYPDLK